MTQVIDLFTLKSILRSFDLFKGKKSDLKWPQKSKLLKPYQMMYLMKTGGTSCWSVRNKKHSWVIWPLGDLKRDLIWPQWPHNWLTYIKIGCGTRSWSLHNMRLFDHNMNLNISTEDLHDWNINVCYIQSLSWLLLSSVIVL